MSVNILRVDRKSRKSGRACSERQWGPEDGIIILKHVAYLSVYIKKQYYMLGIEVKKWYNYWYFTIWHFHISLQF
jgi:hypothetical protein